MAKRPIIHHTHDETLDQQACAWVRRMTAGKVRPRDADALKAWCAQSGAHLEAFQRAHRSWRELDAAARLASEHDAELAALRAKPYRPGHAMARRRFLAGAASTAVLASGAVLVRSPLGSWPTLGELQADYRTSTGEQRRIALADSVTVELNTRSSLMLVRSGNGVSGCKLIEGETAFDVRRASQPFTVLAGGGRISTRDALFEVSHLDGNTSLACLQGTLELALDGRAWMLGAAQRVRYDGGGLQGAVEPAPERISNWREGFLEFHETALAEVVAQINRYRPGRLMVLAASLAQRPVSGRFYLNDLDKAIGQIQRLFHLNMTSLPGGIVVLR